MNFYRGSVKIEPWKKTHGLELFLSFFDFLSIFTYRGLVIKKIRLGRKLILPFGIFKSKRNSLIEVEKIHMIKLILNLVGRTSLK